MTELDAEIGPLALELIDEFGKAVEYRIVATGIYNTDTATVENTDTIFNIKGILEEYSGQAFLSGLIEAGDKKLTIAAQAVNSLPTTQDTVLIDTKIFRVVGVKITYSGELAALYELQLRR